MNKKQLRRVLPASLAALFLCASAANADVSFTRSIGLPESLPPSQPSPPLSNTWYEVRQNPDTLGTGTSFGRDGAMTIGITGDYVHPSTAFYRTEGVTHIVHNGTAAEVDLYLDPAWQNRPVRAGFWVGSEVDPMVYLDSWGIIEFVTGSGYGPASNFQEGDAVVAHQPTETGFRVWDSRSPGIWTMVDLDIDALWGTWVTLRTELDIDAQEYDYFINDVPAGSFPFEANPVTQIRELLFAAYDYSAGGEAGSLAQGFAVADYSVSWNGLKLDANSATISGALSLAAPGAVLSIGPGTYAENLTINKTGITLDGTDATIQVASGNALTVAADDVTLIGLSLVKTGSAAGNAIDVSGAVTRSNLTLTDVSATNFNTGLKVSDSTSIDGLTVRDSHFDNNTFGWYLSKSPANATTVTDVTVTNTSFNDNGSKGIYAEKLDNATFTDIEVINSGTNLVTWPPSNGVDINLKWSDYSDIIIQDSLFQNGGLYTESLQGNLAGVLVIKARSDGNYATPAATLSNVQILNNTFTASNPLSIVGLRLGEPAKSNAGPTNVMVTGNTFSGYKTSFLNTTLAPLTATMIADNTFSGSSVRVVRGSETPAVYTTLTDAVAAAVNGDILEATGTFTGNVTLAVPNLTLDGNGSSAQTGMITVTAANATITGMDITNPTGLAGIYVNKVGGATITDNDLDTIGTTNTTNPIQAIYVLGGVSGMSEIRISGNDIDNVGNPAVAYTNKGIHFGDAGSAAFVISGVEVSDNTISNINAASNKGAYGISFNYGSSSTGSIDDLEISNNVISNLTGGWVHAIGMETNTTNTSVTLNTISNLSASGTDEAGIFFEKNPGAATAIVQRNSFAAGMEYGVALHPTMTVSVDASQNFWGAAGGPTAGAKASTGVTVNPWFISTAFNNATQLSDFVEAPPPPPPPVDPTIPTPEDVEEIVDNIVIPPTGSGESISEEVIAVVEQAATATTGLASNIVENIETVNTDTAIGALTTIGNVVNVTGNAAANTSSSGNTTGSTSTVASGTTALNSFSTLLAAIDTKSNNVEAPVVLTPVQKTAVQEATIQAAASVVKILTAAPSAEEKKAVLESLGNIITSNVNLGVALTTAQATSLLDAADQATSAAGDADTQLETSIPLTPQNKELISKELLTVALEGSGITEAELDTFLAELAKAINPADVNVGDINGAEALQTGFTGALGDGGGSISFDADTGNTSFTVGGANTAQSLNGRTLQAVTTERTIPGRVISSNVVASSFPDGIRVKGDGSVVITSSRIASVVVPASYDPINFYADLRALGVTSVDSLGNLTIDDGGSFHFSGTFDYTGVVSGGGAVLATALTAPTGTDEADLGFIYKVTYRDGTTQTIQPYLIEDSFVASVRSRGLTVITDRNSGVINVSGRIFRPSYFVDAHDATTLAFWNANKDASGLAYRPIDINADGVPDYQVLSQTTVQVAYGTQW